MKRFWDWYERHYVLNLGIAAFLLGLQIFHLYWLTTDVVLFKISGESYFHPTGPLLFLILLADYLEIPAILSASLIYINKLRQGFSWQPVLYLFFLNSQWFHVLWITDEFVVESLRGGFVLWPAWLAWIAISIDYLELPVVYGSAKRFLKSMLT